jgi:hypothetical protein
LKGAAETSKTFPAWGARPYFQVVGCWSRLIERTNEGEEIDGRGCAGGRVPVPVNDNKRNLQACDMRVSKQNPFPLPIDDFANVCRSCLTVTDGVSFKKIELVQSNRCAESHDPNVVISVVFGLVEIAPPLSISSLFISFTNPVSSILPPFQTLF